MQSSLFEVERQIASPRLTVQLRKSVWTKAEPIQVVMATNVLVNMVSSHADTVSAADIRSGDKRLRPLGRTSYLSCGAPILIKPRAAGTIRSLGCVFSNELVEQMMEMGFDPARIDPTVGWNLSSPAIAPLIAHLIQELKQPGFASELLVDSLGLAMAVELSRALVHRNRQPHLKGGLAQWQLRRIDSRLREMGKPPANYELAELCGVSERHLMRAFRTATGHTLQAHVEARQLEKAVRLLQTDMPLKIIAASLGFSSPQNFSAAFKRMTNATPSQYRQRHRAGIADCHLPASCRLT